MSVKTLATVLLFMTGASMNACSMRIAKSLKAEPVTIICALSRCHVAADNSGDSDETGIPASPNEVE